MIAYLPIADQFWKNYIMKSIENLENIRKLVIIGRKKIRMKLI